jgi:hypothetical protein
LLRNNGRGSERHSPFRSASSAATPAGGTDPCYRQACDNIDTVLSGVRPLDAKGLAVEPPGRTDKAEAAVRMRGGARRSMVELGAGAAYATWYFAMVRDPFGPARRGRASLAPPPPGRP